MSEIWIGVLIGVLSSFAISIFVFLYKLIANAIGFSGIPNIHTDLGIAVIEHDKNNQKVKIKIAYAGSNPQIVRKIELTSSLSLAAGKDSLLAWVQLARGYLTDDWEGLQTVFWQRFARKEPVWIRKPVNIILGIVFSLLIISLLFNPLGWIMLLFGPYNNLKIVSSDVNTKEMQTGANKVPPFLIKPSEESEFLIDYSLSIKSRHFAPTKAEYVRDMPEKPLWKLPRPGHHILRGKVKLLIKTPGLLATYRINLDKHKEDFVLIPSRDN